MRPPAAVGTRFRELHLNRVAAQLALYELAVVRGQVQRPQLNSADRVLLAAASGPLPRARWNSFLAMTTTLLRWHRQLLARRWTHERRRGRPSVDSEMRAYVLRFARENPRGGHQRIAGEKWVHAARLYSWMRPPRRSRRRISIAHPHAAERIR